jgi:hypothetical protein
VGGEQAGAAAMRTGPQIECQGCGLPMLLAFAGPDPSVVDGAGRRLVCSWCEHVHVWSIASVRGADGGSRPSLGSSVE